MGLLSLGTPLHWDQAKNFSEHVRSHGIDQFVNTWLRLKDWHGDELLWGDEVFHHGAICSKGLCDTPVVTKRMGSSHFRHWRRLAQWKANGEVDLHGLLGGTVSAGRRVEPQKEQNTRH